MTATAYKTFDNHTRLDRIDLNVDGYSLRLQHQTSIVRDSDGNFLSADLITKYSIQREIRNNEIGSSLPYLKVRVVNLSDQADKRKRLGIKGPYPNGTVVISSNGLLDNDDLLALEEASAIARVELRRLTDIFEQESRS